MQVFILILLFLFTSCYKGHLYVQHEKIDRDALASTYIQTPDPRQANPPRGQKLSVSWDFPLSLYKEDLNLILTVRYWNNQEETINYPITKKRGYTTFFFEDHTNDRSKRILTYMLQVHNKKGEVIEEWKHHFWTKLIELNKDEKKPSVPSERLPANQ
ncbi:MAG: hypothetical protein HZB76_02145 [Chlamydiae bacterium]|nr:hypothetical protein [Chlamydiota bacterium]